MTEIEIELELNSLNEACQAVITEMYQHYTDTQESMLNGIPVNEHPMYVCSLSGNWRTKESMDSILEKLVESKLVLRLSRESTSDNKGMDTIVFNKVLVDSNLAILDIIKQWNNTKRLSSIMNYARTLREKADKEQDKALARLRPLIPDILRVTDLAINEDPSLLDIHMTTTSLEDKTVTFPAAVVNSSDPVAAYAAFNTKNSAETVASDKRKGVKIN